jgi:cell division protein FtsB
VTAAGAEGAANLRLQLAELRRDLADKADGTDVAALSADVAGQVEELAGLRRRTDEIAASVEALERELRHELATTVAGLVRRLHYLDRRAREADGATVVDLTPGPDLVALAARAELGESRREQLLGPAERERRERAVRAAQEWRSEHRQAVAAALAASLAIARSTPGSAPRRGALAELGPARAAVEALRGRRAEVLAAAELAQKELTADAEVAQRHGDAIEQGRRAWTNLCTRLRSRLGEVIDRAELTPRWFDAELGPGPLPADADAWLDAGAELLAYRATYGVVDETSALGPAPGAGASSRQRAWHARLVAGFRAFR